MSSGMAAPKRGLRNPLDDAQVRKAVVALKKLMEVQESKQTKQQLLANPPAISCIITRKIVPGKSSLKPIQIDLPHSVLGAANDVEMCLFVKDTDKERIKKALKEEPVPGLAKVMTLKKLKKEFSTFEDKRALAGAYGMFLVDDRILPYMKTPLGTKFFVKKKQPIPVRISRKEVSAAIRAVFHRTTMFVSTGACTNVKVAHVGMSLDEIVTNIIVGMNNCAAHISKGWLGIQSISIKTPDSVSHPIYNALAKTAALPAMSKQTALQKRKLEEEEGQEGDAADGTVDGQTERANKKARVGTKATASKSRKKASSKA
ncbi:TPA: hypothetical protein N0F65_013029 [Lagenidium giganteum]|uniref:Ribosomal protein L1 n=1 Tax=Lagenidium giganteum TaxID=4803 RepID=A0AAV2YP85_9STRA|nr:TPA: hypothetical protein N0F65_013029 [Lagenidium giganteum]